MARSNIIQIQVNLFTRKIGSISSTTAYGPKTACRPGDPSSNHVQGNVVCVVCCIFRLAYGCCALQTLVKIVFFSFFALKTQKSKKFAANFYKKQFFFSFHQNAGQLFYSQKISFFSQNPTFTYNKKP